MKKFYAILAAGMTAFSMNAQALHFIVNGKEEPAGSKIDITSTFEFDDKAYSYMFNPKMQLMADAAGPVSATVTFTNGECDPVFDELTWETGANLKIQWCAFGGACQFVEVGKSLTQTANLSANTPADMEMEFVGQIGDYQNLDEQKITAECVVKCNFGGKDYELTLTVNKGTGAGVDDVVVDENMPAEYFDLQGRRVMNPAKGLYIVRQGSKVAKKIIR